MKNCNKCGFEFRPTENFCARCHFSRPKKKNLKKWELVEIIAKTYSISSFIYYRQMGGGLLKTQYTPAEVSDIKKELYDLMVLSDWSVRE